MQKICRIFLFDKMFSWFDNLTQCKHCIPLKKSRNMLIDRMYDTYEKHT